MESRRFFLFSKRAVLLLWPGQLKRWPGGSPPSAWPHRPAWGGAAGRHNATIFDNLLPSRYGSGDVSGCGNPSSKHLSAVWPPPACRQSEPISRTDLLGMIDFMNLRHALRAFRKIQKSIKVLTVRSGCTTMGLDTMIRCLGDSLRRILLFSRRVTRRRSIGTPTATTTP